MRGHSRLDSLLGAEDQPELRGEPGSFHPVRPDLRGEGSLLPLQRGLLCQQLALLQRELLFLGEKLLLLSRERPLLRLQCRLLGLQRRLLALQRRLLRLQRIGLGGEFLLLVLQVGLQLLGLVVLLGVLLTLGGGRVQLDGDEQRAVVAGPEIS